MKNWQTQSKLVIGVFAIILISVTAASAADSFSEPEWKFDAAVYLWAASIDGKTTEFSKLEMDFGDIFSDLQFAFMGEFGAHKGPWSFMVDLIYLDADDMVSLPGGVRASAEITNWVITPAVSYTLLADSWGNMDAMFGFRYLNLEAILTTGPERVDAGDQNWDVIIGVLGKVNFLEKWFVQYHLDGGLGESVFTWQALAGVGYSFSWVDASIGYRYLFWNFEDAALIDDMSYNGPYVAAKFYF